MATAGVKRARKAYDVTFKLKAVDFAEKESKEAAARQFGVDPKTIREWCQKKEQLVALKTSGKSKKKRLVGAGRKALDSDLEEALFSWIMELRSRNLRVSRCMIRVQARTMSLIEPGPVYNPASFRARGKNLAEGNRTPGFYSRIYGI